MTMMGLLVQGLGPCKSVYLFIYSFIIYQQSAKKPLTSCIHKCNN